MVVAEIEELKRQALRRVEITFAQDVDPSEFADMETVRVAQAACRIVTITFTGSVDPVLKRAAQFEVETIVSHDGDLESAFLAYYEDDDAA